MRKIESLCSGGAEHAVTLLQDLSVSEDGLATEADHRGVISEEESHTWEGI